MADSEQKYSLLFTRIGARKSETAEVARSYADCLDWAEARRHIVEDNILSLNKESTRKCVGSDLDDGVKKNYSKSPRTLAKVADLSEWK